MIKKIMATISTLLILTAVLTGCGDPVADDMIDYVNNQMKPLAELQSKVAKEFSTATEDENATNEMISAKLKDGIIPVCDELIKKTKAVVPKTEEVSKIHSKYTELVTKQREAMALFLEAFQKNDESLMNTAGEKMEQVGKLSTEYSADVEALKKEHDIVNAK